VRPKLARPAFRLSDSRDKLGEWNGATRTLTIGLHHILSHSWEAVLETLRHEMAHQYVHEVLGLPGAPPHGEAFAEACRVLRCDARACADPRGLERLEDSGAEQDKILQRIRELLALAGSPNEHEAANAMRMAQRYLLKYNLDLAELDRERDYGVRHLGKCSRRTQEYEYTLATILECHFFVLPLWTFSYDPLRDRAGRILQICGTQQNLAVAEYVYDYVLRVAESLWEARRRELGKTRTPGKRGTKLQYLAGLLRGLKDKLDAEKQSLQEERGLVWAGDTKLAQFQRHLNPRVEAVSSFGVARNNQFHAGIRDGRKITIRRGVGGSSARRGRLLAGPGN
jgi:hypothetical protein